MGPESREADGCPSFLEKRDRRERSFFIEKAHSARRFSPQGDRVRAPCPNKRHKDCVCHRESNNEDTDPHTILNALLVLAMIERKLYSYQNARFKQNDDVFSRRPLYYGRAGNDVICCRRPTGGVFICMLHTRVTLTAFPIATPRGHSSKFPLGEHIFCIAKALRQHRK